MFIPVALLAGCPGSGSVTDNGPGGGDTPSEAAIDLAGDSAPPVSVDQACSDSATARCTRRQACSNDAWATRNYGDLGTCVARMRLACLGSLGAPDTAATAVRTEACATELPALTCDDLFNGKPQGDCTTPVGPLAVGVPCQYNGQCQTSFCHVPHGVACGTCAGIPTAGDACSETAECGPYNMECVKATGETAGTCQPPLASGGACDKDHACGFGLSCVGATAKVAGACQAAGATVGADCDPKRKTGPGCEGTSGLGCDDATSKCVVATFVQDQQACDNKTALCGGGGRCVIASGATAGTCFLPAADGKACGLDDGAPCLAPARCIVAAGQARGTCELPDAAACKGP